MKAKQKPSETRVREGESPRKSSAGKKRPAAHTASSTSRPAKAASAEKAAPAAVAARDKSHAKAAPGPKKAAGAAAAHAAPAEGTRHTAHKEAHGPTHAAHATDKRPLGLERRAPVMPEDRQSQLKLLIARGKEQGYLTYAQVNDHLPSEIVDPEQIEDIVNTINDMGIPVY